VPPSEISQVENIIDGILDTSNDLKERIRLLAALERVRQYGFEKLDLRNTTNNEKIKWSKVIISSCTASDNILKNLQQDEMKQEIQELREQVDEIRSNKND
jgi:hypothetical protein